MLGRLNSHLENAMLYHRDLQSMSSKLVSIAARRALRSRSSVPSPGLDLSSFLV